MSFHCRFSSRCGARGISKMNHKWTRIDTNGHRFSGIAEDVRWRMGQRHEHLPGLTAILSDVVLDRGVGPTGAGSAAASIDRMEEIESPRHFFIGKGESLPHPSLPLSEGKASTTLLPSSDKWSPSLVGRSSLRLGIARILGAGTIACLRRSLRWRVRGLHATLHICHYWST